MLDWLNHIGVRGEARRRSDQRALAAMALFAILAAVTPAATQAADCPTAREPSIPPSEEPAINIAMHKKQLLKYHVKDQDEDQADNYIDDIKLVLDDARGDIEGRADQVRKPAIVLDIDETSLSNWKNIKANNFGLIKGGPCSEEPDLACGFDEWILKASAPAIKPTREFFNSAIVKNIAVF